MHNEQIRELARARARDILSQSASFHAMSVPDQKMMYHDVVEEQTRALSDPNAVSSAMRRGRRGSSQEKASDLINDKRHEDALDFSNAGEALEDVMEAVDFPEFVGGLLDAVFQGNMKVMKEQTQYFMKLMKEATKSTAEFVKGIDKTAAFAYLAENKPNEFNIAVEEDGEGGEKIALTDPGGDKADETDAKVKMAIMDAKIKMAQEHRALLRETLLMGVTRLVVEKGKIEAEVLFDFKGNRKMSKKDKALMKTSKSNGTSARTGGLFGFFSPVQGGHTNSNRTTQFSVSSASSSADDTLKTKLRGFVNIEFKTDYFKLDNFANMYAQPTEEEKKAALPSGG